MGVVFPDCLLWSHPATVTQHGFWVWISLLDRRYGSFISLVIWYTEHPVPVFNRHHIPSYRKRRKVLRLFRTQMIRNARNCGELGTHSSKRARASTSLFYDHRHREINGQCLGFWSAGWVRSTWINRRTRVVSVTSPLDVGELKIRLMNEGRYDERLKGRVEESTCLTYTGLHDRASARSRHKPSNLNRF